MKKIWILCAIAMIGLLSSVTVWGKVPEMSEILMQAYIDKQPIPVLSQFYPDLNVKTAYMVQKSYLQKRLVTDKIGGYKAGLTSEEARKRFGMKDPVAGILYQSGKKVGSPVINKSDFIRPVIETEIGFVVGKTIDHQLKDTTELKTYISGVMPAIELPDLGFTDSKRVGGVDLIAANGSAVQFITGQELVQDGRDINQIAVTLYYNGQAVVNEGQGNDALGDQWNAALWLVNTSLTQGWIIEPGQVLLTGALGKIVSGKAGSYVADYGTFGRIAFEIQ